MRKPRKHGAFVFSGRPSAVMAWPANGPNVELHVFE
jgi:hypothetical protein